ncbi:Hypothetical protein CINCED_3A019256 [Cinara cedri]|uniref:Uncharacterized protein n=1 Tax=Cinara cedri TaxID=506608 RepID=A0A5E4MFE2_9HEMI|nr:Hypothetical protein CINCED_3A019256 [Cinara cedri]
MTNHRYPCSLLLLVTAVAAVNVRISAREVSRTPGNATGAAEKTPDDQNSKAAADRLRDRMIRLTSERSNAVAALTIAQQREYMLALLEREKYECLHATTDKMRRLVHGMRQADDGAYQETCDRRQTAAVTARPLGRSGRRLHVCRQLLAAAEVGLTRIETDRQLRHAGGP